MGSTDKSANDSDVLPAAFPSFTTTETPVVFQEKLDRGQPMLILFYDDAQQVTPNVRAEVDAVMTQYRGLIDLVTCSVGGPATDAGTLDGFAPTVTLEEGIEAEYRWLSTTPARA